MKILVTGGAGFIGSAMVNYLLSKGHNVCALDLPEQFIRHPPLAGVTRSCGNIMDVSDLAEAINGHEYVIHFAGRLGVQKTEQFKLKTLHINILGTANILEACIKEKVKKILFASSSEVYGDQLTFPIAETNPVNPKSVYAVSKLAGECFIKSYQQRYGLNYSIIRFFNIYGEHQRDDFVVSRFVQAVKDHKPPIIYGDGKQVRAFCHVDDAIRGAYLALVSDGNGVYNIGNPNGKVSIEELALKIISLSGQDLKPTYIPLAESDRTKNREIYNRIPDISKARKLLGYSPSISLDEGLSRMLM